MSKSSGSPGQIISLPQGGGALHGIGEKFSPDLFTGTGNFTVSITLPPGRNGFQPQLNLVYSTGNGNGPFGLGWGLSIPGVSRKTSKGVPLYDDAKDTFLLSGAEDLVPVPGGALETTSYRPRSEGLFARIYHHRNVSNNYWEVRSKDGLISLYGTPEALGNDPAVIAKPADRSRIFAWKLTSTTDPFGNRIEYVYERDTRTDSPHFWDQLYLSQIRYIDYGDPSNPQFLVTVDFNYEDRPDPFSEYHAGFEIRAVRRCTTIETYTHPDAAILTRTYHLVYLDQRGLPPEQLPHNGVSLLSQLQIEGHDGTSSEQLPPVVFGYTKFEPEKRTFFPITGSELPVVSLAQPNYELADLFGNGLPDILEMNGTVRYWRNLGSGRIDLPREMRDAPAGVSLGDRGVQLLDANGDGQIDLLVTTESISGYYPLRFSGLWDRRSFQRYQQAPSFDLKDPEVRMVDLDGDGVTDAIRSGSRLECFFNDPKDGWNGTRWVERQALEIFPNVNFSDPRVKWGDMTGDGLQDIILVYDGITEYWPSFGRGDWGKRITMRNSPRFPYGYDPRRILVGDVDGDGLADIVYVDDRKVTLWINQSGNSWGDPIEIHGTPPVSDTDAVRLVDLLGLGISGVLWSADANGLSRSNMFFLDFTGGIKPYLLNEMDNSLGALTRVGYAPSTHFYLEDEKCFATRWKTPLPFPVQVVARVEVIDAISGGKLTTEYSYHHGYWDGAEREFRGFGRVDQRDTEVFDEFHAAGLHSQDRAFNAVPVEYFSPPTETRTWFHQGPIGDEFGEWTETDFSSEFWPGDQQVLSRPQPMTDFLQALPRCVKRDALRAMRGHILRTELYALDGTERQDHPYTITESLPAVCGIVDDGNLSRLVCDMDALPLDWKTDASAQRIFFPHRLAERTTQWERGDEPMTQFTFTEDYDQYGQPRSLISLAVPRGRDFGVVAASSEPYLATHTVTTYAQRDDAQRYIVDRVARATTYEVLNDGRSILFDLKEAINNGSASLSIIGQTLNFYDGPAFRGLAFGQIGDYGALMRTEQLALTREILHEAYKSGDTVRTPPEEPPYLAPNGSPIWTVDYPLEFRTLLPTLAGYTYQTGGAGSDYVPGYFVATERRRYDFHDGSVRGRGLITAKRDSLGRDTTIVYDAFDLLPTAFTDPAGLQTKASYDYRVLQPHEVTDPNDNLTVDSYTPLGLLESTALLGKHGEGDTRDKPSTRFEYNFLAFPSRGQPVSVHTVRRVHHANEPDISPSERDETIETVEYSDGFGRLLQTRTQAEDIIFGDPVFGDVGLPNDQSLPVGDAVGHQRSVSDPPHLVVSGWQTYDNKCQVVEKYEPFFSDGWDYAPPTDTQRGQKVTMYYDPRGHVIRTVNPDGSEERVIYGVPADLTRPEQFTPTPWEAYTYDANDNAGRTHPTLSTGYQDHWHTPTSIVIDALGRTIQAVQRNGPDPASDWFTTRSTYDIRGNLLTITDALGQLAFNHVYDLTNKPLRIENIDAGIRRSVLDAAGNLIEQRDSKNALILHAYDVLHRPIRLWARDRTGETLTLREHLLYGDSPEAGLSADQAATHNLLGKLYKHYDEAGRLTFETYDFKDNVLQRVREVISDSALLAVFNPAPANWQVQAFRVNWEPPIGRSLESYAGQLLDPRIYVTMFTYDALNRIKSMHYPQDVEGTSKLLRLRYNRAGALEHIELDGTTYVEHIAYNAKGQRTLIIYGNQIMTRRAYDPKTFRLARLRSEYYTIPAALTYRPSGPLLQDFAYEYDLVGNIRALHDRTPESGIPNSVVGRDALDRTFIYDPIYRLHYAGDPNNPLRFPGGRECDMPSAIPWDDSPRCIDLTRTRAYLEHYVYDPVGNLKQLEHRADGGFTRVFALVPNGNRLATMAISTTVYSYTYDPSGNLTRENTERHFEWDHSDRMRVYRTQTGNAEPSVHAHYLYDASGQRVKKLIRKQGGQTEVTVYIDGVLEHQRIAQGGTTRENNTLHVMDDDERIARVRVGTPSPNDTTPVKIYHLGDHLDSSNIVVDDTGNWVNREEYTPYGETSFGSFARKRYRFTGKERDEESKLYYHGARYYAPWLGKWISCDPTGSMMDGPNLYLYSRNNPLRFSDPQGTQADDEQKTNQANTSSGETPSAQTVTTEFGVIDITKPLSDFDFHVLQKTTNLTQAQAIQIRAVLTPKQLNEVLSHVPAQGGRFYAPVGEVLERVDVKAAEFSATGTYIVMGLVGGYAGAEIIAAGAEAVEGTAVFKEAGMWAGSHAPKLVLLGMGALRILSGTSSPQSSRSDAIMEAGEQELVPAWRLVTREITAPRITPSNYRGITPALRQWAVNVARRWGYTGQIDVGHIVEHEFTEPGKTVLVRPLERAINEAEGPLIRLAAQARRLWNQANPSGPQLYTRH
jgi:RHS repeat-associated protein